MNENEKVKKTEENENENEKVRFCDTWRKVCDAERGGAHSTLLHSTPTRLAPASSPFPPGGNIHVP
eukprot:5484268-Pyramimonas_sp.AAC.1